MIDVATTAIAKPRAEALPATLEEMLSRRTFAITRTLNDAVDEIHRKLWVSDDPKYANYQKLLDAVYDEDAVEGSCSIDNAKAAELIRDYAQDRQHPDAYVADKKLATIVKSLNVVLRRYKMSRKERATRVGDEQVPPAE